MYSFEWRSVGETRWLLSEARYMNADRAYDKAREFKSDNALAYFDIEYRIVWISRSGRVRVL